MTSTAVGATIPRRALQWVERSVGDGSRATAAWPLLGGRSSAVHAVDLRDARGVQRRLVLRRILDREWLALEPDLAYREAAALQVAAPLGLSPRLVAVDGTGEACGAPAVLSERLQGVVVLQPRDLDAWLRQLAQALARIHALPADDSRFPLGSRWFEATTIEPPGWTRNPTAWQQLIEVVRSAPAAGGSTFLHRDYHPGNVLWQGGRLTGVVDWVNACIGSPSVDLGHCRHNLVALFGIDAADRFLAHYIDLTSYEHDTMGDVETLLDSSGSVDLSAWHQQERTDLDTETVRARIDGYAATLARLVG